MTITMRKTLCTSTSTISTASQTLHAIFCVITERHIRICHPFRYSYLLTQANVAVGIAITTVVSIVGGCLSLYGADADDEGCCCSGNTGNYCIVCMGMCNILPRLLLYFEYLQNCKTSSHSHTGSDDKQPTQAKLFLFLSYCPVMTLILYGELNQRILNNPWYQAAEKLAKSFCLLNNVTDAIIYGWRDKQIRHCIKILFKKRTRRV